MVLAAASCGYEPPEPPPDAAPDAPADTGPFRQRGYLKASNTGAGDELGSSVALSADGLTLAVGAPSEDSKATGVDGDQTNGDRGQSGAVYVFTRPDTSAPWRQQAYVKASNTAENAAFGTHVALSADGKTLAIAAQLESTGAPSSGAAYVFMREGAAWTEQAFIKASDTAEGDRFGSSLALSADGATLAVGALYEDGDGGMNSGAVYMFTLADRMWSQHTYLKAPDSEPIDHFGASVALSEDGSTLAVGTATNGNGTYVFTRSGPTWTEQARFGVSGGDYGSGIALSRDGRTLAIGASREDLERGAVYIFQSDGITWTRRAHLQASYADAGDQLGLRLALSADGSKLAVGASGEASAAVGIGGDQADDTSAGSGAVYVFELAGAAWIQRYYVKASNTGMGDRFGTGVALSGDGSTLAAGASGEASAATGIDGDQADDRMPSSGAAYVFQ